MKSEDIFEGLVKPFKNLVNLVVGTILANIPLLNLAVTGYSARNYEKPKEEITFSFDTFVRDWVNGLKMAVISFIYEIPVFVLLFIMGKNFLSSLTTKGTISLSAVLGTMVWPIILFIVLLPAMTRALMKFIDANYSFGEAFKFGEVFKEAYTGKFILDLLVAYIVIGVVSAILAMIPVINLTVPYFSQVAFWTMMGLAKE